MHLTFHVGEPYPEEKYKEYAKGVTIKKFKRVAVVQYRVPDQKWRSYGVVYASLKSEDSAKAGTVRMVSPFFLRNWAIPR